MAGSVQQPAHLALKEQMSPLANAPEAQAQKLPRPYRYLCSVASVVEPLKAAEGVLPRA